MATETIHASALLEATPEAIYAAWLDGARHASMTGGGATSDGRVGRPFTAWDGYITGHHLELAPARRIVQAWRTGEFPASAGDSRLIVVLEAESGGTRVTIVHTDIPEGQGARYESGWEEHYFAPMRRYFALAPKAGREGKAAERAKPKAAAAAKAAGAKAKATAAAAGAKAKATAKVAAGVKAKATAKVAAGVKAKATAKAKVAAGARAKAPAKPTGGTRPRR